MVSKTTKTIVIVVVIICSFFSSSLLALAYTQNWFGTSTDATAAISTTNTTKNVANPATNTGNTLATTPAPENLSGGVCVKDTALSWFPWGAQDETWGGATCDKTGSTWKVNCPAGQTKNSLFSVTASGQGGEGAICSNSAKFPTGKCFTGMSGIWDGYTETGTGVSCTGNTVTCPTGTDKTTLWNLTASGKGGEGALCRNNVSGGLCFNGASGKWDGHEAPTGGATCDKSQPVWSVICPAGKTKRVVTKWAGFGGGGEGALCL